MANLAGPRPLGNSIESMDLGFALQARCLEAVAAGSLAGGHTVVPVPQFIDELVAVSFLDRYGRSGESRPVWRARPAGRARVRAGRAGRGAETGPVDSRTTRALGSTLLRGARPVRMYVPSRAAASVPSRVANRFTVLREGWVSSE